MVTIRENTKKLKELILYISQKCASDPNFGATKLNKILYFSDFASFAYYGKPITGAEYQKLEQGPAPRLMIPVRGEMIRAGELGIQEMPVGSYVQQRPVNLRSPELEVFTAREISLVDAVIEALSGHTAKAASDLSHKMSGWKLAALKETIPYSAIFLCDDQKLTESDISRGQEIAREHGLLASPKI